MRRSRLVWRVYPPYLVVCLLGLLVVSLLVGQRFHRFYLDRVAVDLAARAEFFAQSVDEELALGQADDLQHLAQRLGRATNTRLTVIDERGVVLADSEHDPATMENHRGRPEVDAALAGQPGRDVRRSPTLGIAMMYAAVPRQVGRGALCVRAALPVEGLRGILLVIDRQLLGGAAVLALLGALASLLSVGAVGHALQRLRSGADRFAAGDLASRLELPPAAELAGLAQAMNTMAGQLDERLATVEHQRNELQAVLSSMVEGVLAVDTQQRLLRLNAAAAKLFGVDDQLGPGRLLHEVVRNRELHRFVERALKAQAPIEGELVVFDGEERYLQAHGTPLSDGVGRPLGVLVVLHDITRVRRLEQVRREFVANVSHELRTPITSIRGFAETLLRGAIEQPEDARHFLEIIDHQAERLGNIIEDLLELSHLEQAPESEAIELTEGPLTTVLQAAAQACAVKAQERGVRLDVAGDPDLQARLNAALLEEAVVNLLDNAVTYSEPGDTVEVRARRAPGEIQIAVADHGCGIAAQHLPRLFERFYRVDKHRSRKLGGTGLGLAIVKHIVNVHGGRVEVESTPGQGSTFTICLPA
jgi:two-component system phosphate regulon sensor histidine kinase PhoR